MVSGGAHPLPADAALAAAAQALDETGHWAELVDEHWRWAYVTEELRRSYGALREEVEIPIGAGYFSRQAGEAREALRGGPTTLEIWRRQLAGVGAWMLADFGGDRDAVRAAIDPRLADVLDGIEASADVPVLALRQYGTTTSGAGDMDVPVFAFRVHRPDGTLAGSAIVIKPAPGMATLAALTGHGDLAHYARIASLAQAARRPAAILFADLEASSPLARRLPTASYFALGRRLVRAADRCVIDAGGVVGRHVGDGVVAFFLAETSGGESAAARGCIEAARALRAATAQVATDSGLEPEEVTLRFGLHWGSTLYAGLVTTPGRGELVALGDEVNETARIEACATGGRALASKDLIERLDPPDAQALGLDPAQTTYTPLGDLPSATEKARRDAPAIAVCEV